MLKTVYANAYNDNIEDIENSAHLRAWGEQVLLALALKLVADKLAVLMRCSMEGKAIAARGDEVVAYLMRLRDAIAHHAENDRTVFANDAIALWSRMISIFRNGKLPASPHAYQAISSTPIGQLPQDANARAASLGELGIALALLAEGQACGMWKLSTPTDEDLTCGALTSTSTWVGAEPRTIFIVRSAALAVELQKQGALARDNTIVVHADDAWHKLQALGLPNRRSRSRKFGRSGKSDTSHVSVAQLLDEAGSDVASLRSWFASKVGL